MSHTDLNESMSEQPIIPGKLSVCIRTHNDLVHLKRAIPMLFAQKGVDFELVVCNDNSTDGSTEYLAQFPQVKSIVRPTGAYNPAKMLNSLINQTDGEIIVFNNGDAIPLDENYLATLTAPFKDRLVSAVYARQYPRADASVMVRKDYDFAFGDKPATRLPGFFSLVGSAIRRSSWEANPFDQAYQYSEDVAWTRLAQMRGEGVCYVPEAHIEHSHEYNPTELKKRFYGDGYASAQLLGEAPSYLHAFLGACLDFMRDLVWGLKHRELLAILKSSLLYRLRQRLSTAAGGHAFLERLGD